jgi:hypothetical protein
LSRLSKQALRIIARSGFQSHGPEQESAFGASFDPKKCGHT